MYGRYWTTGDREALKKEVITAKNKFNDQLFNLT